MNVFQTIVSALKAEKTEYVFGLPSGDLFYDALYDEPQIKAVQVREESAGPFMALGYARIKARPGVCYGSAGPGITNLASGVLEAYSACIPVIVIGASANRSNAGMGAFQEVDLLSLMRPITKWCDQITEPDRTAWVIRRAFSIAANGKPGPVYIDIPGDIGRQEVTHTEYVPAQYPLKTSADPMAVQAAVELITSAERPVLVAGGGAVSARAFAELRELAELLGMPVMTTPCGRGIIPEDHALSVGQVGLYFTEPGEELYGRADLLITVGSRNEDFQSGQQRFFPEGARYIQIDIDPGEIGRNWIPDVAIVGDAGLVLQELIGRLTERGVDQDRREGRLAELRQSKAEYSRQVAEDCRDDSVPLKSKRIIRQLNEVFGGNTILVNENGSQDLWSYYWGYYNVLDINACVAPGEQTCMGGGCAAAVGAKLAAPERRVVCPTGDGAFQMFMKELPAVVQCGAAVTFVVLNNNSLGWVKNGQRLRGDRYIAVDFEVQPDFVQIAEASQCRGERVEKPKDIRPALERALQANKEGRTSVVEFVVDSEDFAYGFRRYYERLK